MKGWKRVLPALMTVVGAGFLTLACSEGSDPVSSSTEAPAIPQFLKQNCLAWSCESGRCGYDTAHSPGACCILYGNSYPAPKPSCGAPAGCEDVPPGPWCELP